MSWCPKCKNEYKEGITVCSDCGCELIDNLPLVEEDYAKLQEELEKMTEEEKAAFAENFRLAVQEAEEMKETAKPVMPYQNSAVKAEDNKVSAYMLLAFGILGMIVVILGIFGVLPIHLSGAGKYMAYGIMSALFILFIVMGLISMKSYRIFAKKAESENTLRSTMENWFKEEVNAESIDGVVLTDDETSDEEKYFKRTSYMKERITSKFMNLDEAFLDDFIDEMYDSIYEN